MGIVHGAHIGRGRLRERAPVAIEGARGDRIERVHRRQAALLDEIEQRAGVAVKHRLS